MRVAPAASNSENRTCTEAIDKNENLMIFVLKSFPRSINSKHITGKSNVLNSQDKNVSKIYNWKGRGLKVACSVQL